MSRRDVRPSVNSGTVLVAVPQVAGTPTYNYLKHLEESIRWEEAWLAARLEAPLTYYSSDRQQDKGRQR